MDTHALLWHIEGSREESDACRIVLHADGNDVFISMASCWELAIKVGSGKLAINGTVDQLFEQIARLYPFRILSIELAHLVRVSSLPHHHRDPFDRLLAAQSLFEGMLVVSRDLSFDAYGVQRIW